MNSICKRHPITPGQATQEVQLNLQLANLEAGWWDLESLENPAESMYIIILYGIFP